MENFREMQKKIQEQHPFEVVAPFDVMGDQGQAVEKLAQGIFHGMTYQVLHGATGTGKTFTIAKTIEKIQKPTLVIAHNKTLAAQLASEFKQFFPKNYVGYFVSYYDYYQPEAYLPATDTYIAKDVAINDEIDELRHAATCSLFERRDVIIVASVSCIYGLGSPENYYALVLSIHKGQKISRETIIEKLISIRYERNDIAFERGTFRVRGDCLEIYPASSNGRALRIDYDNFSDDEEKILRMIEFDTVSGKIFGEKIHAIIFPASHYVTSEDELKNASEEIFQEMLQQKKLFEQEKKLIEAQRIEQRTKYDLEMISEMGYCTGIENYSRFLTHRKPGQAPYTLIDYFPEDFLLVVDESHVSIPQIRAMYEGDRARKQMLVENGFRLPSAFDNRPLKFSEFEEKIQQAIFISATPAEYECNQAQQIVEQMIRPTGILDPLVEVRPLENQIDDLLSEIHKRSAKKERVLVTTLTKKMAENLTEYLDEMGVRVRYLHSDVKTIERAEIIRDLRSGKFDVLVGINLLREGLDMPEVSLVAILDADKEGFLRSDTSLIQTIGRAARNANGTVLLYADHITQSMQRAIDETNRRRKIQSQYNEEHHITPKTIEKPVKDLIETTLIELETKETKSKSSTKSKSKTKTESPMKKFSKKEKIELVRKLRQRMQAAAKNLDFEQAAELRDMIFEIEGNA